jgi:hypothetical protein
MFRSNRPSLGVEVVVMKVSADHCNAVLYFLCSCLGLLLNMWVIQLFYLIVHEHVFALWFRWLVVCGCPECSCCGGSLLYGGRPSWKFNITNSIIKIFVLPWPWSRNFKNSFIFRERTLEVMPRTQQYWENTQMNSNISYNLQIIL